MSEVRLRQIDYVASAEGYEEAISEPINLVGLQSPLIDYEEIAKRLDEGNDSYQVITGPSGRQYETLVFNQWQMSKARILKPSTSFSSAYKNPANVLETALAAAANPGAAYVYLGSFGNHPTGHMAGADLRHVRRTGRYTTGHGTADDPYKPLGSVEDMAEALINHSLDPTHISADVEAGRLGLGLMSALPTDSVRAAYLNGLDGISHSAAYVPAKLGEDLKSRIYRRGLGEGQPGELTPMNIKDVKQRMPNIYHGLGRVAHIAPLPVFLFPRDVRDKVLVTLGFRGHDDLSELADHAVFQDMSAALDNQDAVITLQLIPRASCMTSVIAGSLAGWS